MIVLIEQRFDGVVKNLFFVTEETIEKKENFKNQFIEDARNELQIAQRETVTIR